MSNRSKLTQALIANMRGARRGGVTRTAGKLQAAGLNKYLFLNDNLFRCLKKCQQLYFYTVLRQSVP